MNKLLITTLLVSSFLTSESHGERINYKPNNSVSPITLPLPQGYTDAGDSLQAGNVAGAGNQTWQLIQNSSLGGPVTNLAVGGTTMQTIATSVTGATVDQLAGPFSLNGCRNDIATSGYSTCVSYWTTATNAITSDNYLAILMPNASVEPIGGLNWSQVTKLDRDLQLNYGNKAFSMWRAMQSVTNGSQADLDALALDETTPFCRTLPDGTVDSLHYGRNCSVPLANAYIQYFQAKLYGEGYIQPWQEFLLSGSAASTANTLNGLVTIAPCVGTVDSASIITTNGTTNTQFAIDSNCNITNLTGTTLSLFRYDILVQVTRHGKNYQGTVRVYPGASDTVAHSVIVDGSSWLTMPLAAVSADTQKISGVIAFQTAAGTDGVDMYLWGAETPNAKFVIHRNASNRLVIIGKNSSNTTVYSVQTASSGAGLITISSGLVYVFFSIDLTQAVPSVLNRLYVNTTPSLSFLTGTSGATINLNVRHNLLTQTSSAGVATLPFKGSIMEMIIWQDYIDWAVVGNIALVENSGTPVDLGSTCSITPVAGSPTASLFCLLGKNGDWGWGVNKGTTGPIIGATLNGHIIN